MTCPANRITGSCSMSEERRSSGRQRFRPLDFWANERVVYEPSREGPVLAGVITQDPRGVDALRVDRGAASAVATKKRITKKTNGGSGSRAKMAESRASSGSRSRSVQAKGNGEESEEEEREMEEDAEDDNDGADSDESSVDERPTSGVGQPHGGSLSESGGTVEATNNGSDEHANTMTEVNECRIIACRRWGRGWQYQVTWAESDQVQWQAADELPAELINAFLQGSAEPPTPMALADGVVDSSPAPELALPPRKRKAAGAAGSAVD